MTYISNFDKVKLLVLIEKRNGLPRTEVDDSQSSGVFSVVQACLEVGWIRSEILPGWQPTGPLGWVLTAEGGETLAGFRELLAPLD